MSFKWMDQDFTDPEIVSNFSASSEQTAFPATNLQTERRSKVWRSNGYFVLASDVTLDFEETASSALRATIPAGTYSSRASLHAAIKTAMDGAAGSNSTYTVTTDAATQKMKITSDGVGGGGIFNLLWTASSAAADAFGWDSSADDTGALSYLSDEIKFADPSEWVLWDFGIQTDCNAFIMIGLRNEGLKISPRATIKLQANETSNFSSPSFETTLTYDDFVISKFEATDGAGIAGAEYRYWRLEIADNDNANGHIELGALFLGDYYETSQGKAEFGAKFDPEDRSKNVFSEGGQTFGDQRPKSELFTVNYKFLSVTERNYFLNMFEDFGVTKPFFLVMDPDVVYLPSLNDSIRYVKFKAAPKFTLAKPGLFNMSISLREEL